MSLKDFKAMVASEVKVSKEYKSYLSVAQEEGMSWYAASKMVMEYLNDGKKLTANDYKEINKLRKWYNELSEEEA